MMSSRKADTTHGVAELCETTTPLPEGEITLSAPGPQGLRTEGTWVGSVSDVTHPVLRGRVLVRWDDGSGRARAQWLPTLSALALRVGDRVLCTWPSNLDEPVVTGVLDGFTPRPEAPHRTGASLALKRDERLAITDEAGNPLVEVRAGDEGPVVRVLHASTALELPGRLSLRADAIELASRGEVRIEARGDVRVNGDFIRLNGS